VKRRLVNGNNEKKMKMYTTRPNCTVIAANGILNIARKFSITIEPVILMCHFKTFYLNKLIIFNVIRHILHLFYSPFIYTAVVFVSSL